MGRNAAAGSSPAGLFDDRRFLFFFIAVFLSNAGGWIQNVAMGWLSLSLRNTPESFGFISFLGSIPHLFFALVGGHLADSCDNRKTLAATQLVCLAVAVTIGIGVVGGWITYGRLAVLAFVNGTASAIAYPVYYTLLTGMADRSRISRVIALNSLQFNLSRFIGPMLFGVLVTAVGTAGCFFTNALSFVPFIASLAMLAGVRSSVSGAAGLVGNIRGGLRYLRSERRLLLVMGVVFFYSFFGLAFLGMLPYIVKNTLHDDPRTLGIVLGALGLGTLFGAAFISVYPRGVPGILRRFFASGFFFPVALAVFGWIDGIAAVSGVALLLGCLMVLFYASGNAYMHLIARDEFRGRVVSFFTTIYLGVYPLGIVSMGWCTGLAGLRPVITVQAATVMAAFGAFAFLFIRHKGGTDCLFREES